MVWESWIYLPLKFMLFNIPSPVNHCTRPVFKTAAIDDQDKFRPLPAPPGNYPYHIDLKDFVPEISAEQLVFQLCGDTGGIQHPFYQHRVAKAMISQFKTGDEPQFFFHLGDVVYNYGQQQEYEHQFFRPFKDYPAPVFAIPGNHDGDIDPFDARHPQSLDAFLKVFCADDRKPLNFAGDTGFLSTTQPNVYYKLRTPLADIIALYSNVPRFGNIDELQRQWFVEQLTMHKKDNQEKALILCLHHSPYSADTNHGSSVNMQLFLEETFDLAGVIPDIIFSGHVHNYQRFTKKYSGKNVPFIIAGAGGYAQLHTIAGLNDPAYPDTSKLLDNVYLEKYCCTNHGFLNVCLSRDKTRLSLKGRYFVIDDSDEENAAAQLFDSFEVIIKKYVS